MGETRLRCVRISSVFPVTTTPPIHWVGVSVHWIDSHPLLPPTFTCVEKSESYQNILIKIFNRTVTIRESYTSSRCFITSLPGLSKNAETTHFRIFPNKSWERVKYFERTITCLLRTYYGTIKIWVPVKFWKVVKTIFFKVVWLCLLWIEKARAKDNTLDEGRCDERLKARVEESTSSGLWFIFSRIKFFHPFFLFSCCWQCPNRRTEEKKIRRI